MNRLSWVESLITETNASTVARKLIKTLQISITQFTDFGSNCLKHLIPIKFRKALAAYFCTRICKRRFLRLFRGHVLGVGLVMSDTV